MTFALHMIMFAVLLKSRWRAYQMLNIRSYQVLWLVKKASHAHQQVVTYREVVIAMLLLQL